MTVYNEFFGFSDSPFTIAPNPRYLYFSEQYNEALAHLLYAQESQGAFTVITGEVGIGKTTICRCFLNRAPSNVKIAFIFNPKLNCVQLLAAICEDLGVDVSDEPITDIHQYIKILNQFLLDEYAQGFRILLVIDEAQNLSDDVLEQLRLLTNLETDHIKLLHIILLGQPELSQKLQQVNLRQLTQRITARYHLNPLSLDDTRMYIYHRLQIVGGKIDTIPQSAIPWIYKKTNGIPRLINILLDRALLAGYSQNERRLLLSTVKTSIKGFNDFAYESTKKFQYKLVLAASVMFSIFGVVMLGVSLNQKENHKSFVAQNSYEKDETAFKLKVSKRETATQETASINNDKYRSDSMEDVHHNRKFEYRSNTSSDVFQPVSGDKNRAVTNSEYLNDGVSLQEAMHVREANRYSNSNHVLHASVQKSLSIPDQQNTTYVGSKENIEKEDIKSIVHENAYSDFSNALGVVATLWNKKGYSLNNLNECASVYGEVRCDSFYGTLHDALELMHPFVITASFDDGGDYKEIYLPVTAVKQHEVVISGLKGDTTISVDLLNTSFDVKELHLFWLPPKGYYGALREGAVGPQVKWLNQIFTSLDSQYRYNSPNLFDNSLSIKVKDFQKSLGLKSDGVVGMHTLMHLSVIAQPSLIPTLKYL